MKTLYESILSSTGTGKFAYKKQIENYKFTPELVKTLDNEVAFYKPHDHDELKKLIAQYMKVAGYNCSLNWIDTSEITDMRYLFSSKITRIFNGDISKWDVSNVIFMCGMFDDSEFNGNISDWNVSNVRNMSGMFYYSEFNGNISDWDVSNVEIMSEMFYKSDFNGNISGWDVSSVEDMHGMFYQSDFNGNISGWDVSKVRDMSYMFCNSKFNQDISKWNVKKVKKHLDVFTNCPIKENYIPDFR